jgi:hypothetical protein
MFSGTNERVMQRLMVAVVICGALSAVAHDGKGQEVERAVAVREQAATVGELVRQTGAACGWTTGLVWVKGDGARVTAFVVDGVYGVTGKGGREVATVTLGMGNGPAFIEGEEVAYVRRELVVGERNEGGDGPHAFARTVLQDQKRGNVYELQWPSARLSGTAHIQTSQRVVVWRSAAGAWRVVGTCEGDGGSGGQGRWSSSQITCTVTWGTGGPAVAWKRRDTFGLISESDKPDFPTLDVETDGASGEAAGVAAVWEKSRLVVHAGESVGTLVERLALWSETWNAVRDTAWKQEAERLWRAALLRANPKLAEGVIAREAVVLMPEEGEVTEGMLRWIAARRQAKGQKDAAPVGVRGGS